MRRLSKVSVCLVVCLLVFSSFGCVFVRGFGTYITGVSSDYYSGHIFQTSKTHPTTASDYNSAVGESIELLSPVSLGDIVFYVQYGADEDHDNGTYTCRIYNATGGANSVPMSANGHFAQAEQVYWGWDLPSTPSFVTFSFNNINLTAGNYTFAFVCVTGIIPTVLDAYGAHIAYDYGSGSGYAGNMVRYISGAWSVVSGSDLIFLLYEYDEPYSPTPSPSSTATSTGLSDSALNVLLGQLFWWLAVLIIVLGPAFVFGVLLKGGTWGFLVGLLAGAGLGYWLMPTLVPLWLVVGVVFAVAAMAWSVMGRSS